MDIFLSLITKIAPLYLIVLLGFVAGKYFKVDKEPIATLLIYFITPLVIFNGVATSSLNLSIVLLPLTFFVLAVLISAIFYSMGKLLWKGTEKNVLAFTSGTGNTGYFGLPVILALFGEEYLSVAVLCIFGFLLYENSLGYYYVARGTFSSQAALKKVLGLPTLYAFMLGLLFLAGGGSIGAELSALFTNFRGAYSVLGMMIIGLGLAGVTARSWDVRFLSMTLSAKFIVWPIVVVVVVLLDMMFFHLFTSTMYPIMLLLSTVPLASNTVAFAAQLNAVPEKAATAVLTSTLIALVYIPLFVTIVLPFLL